MNLSVSIFKFLSLIQSLLELLYRSNQYKELCIYLYSKV